MNHEFVLNFQRDGSEGTETIKKPNKPQSASFQLPFERNRFQTSPFEKMSHHWANF